MPPEPSRAAGTLWTRRQSFTRGHVLVAVSLRRKTTSPFPTTKPASTRGTSVYPHDTELVTPCRFQRTPISACPSRRCPSAGPCVCFVRRSSPQGELTSTPGADIREQSRDVDKWRTYTDLLRFRTAQPRWFFMAIGTGRLPPPRNVGQPRDTTLASSLWPALSALSPPRTQCSCPRSLCGAVAVNTDPQKCTEANNYICDG